MIQSITFKNYKSFRDRTTIALKPITILVGPNNSGKSSVFKLLALLGQSYRDGRSGQFILYEGASVAEGDLRRISHRHRSGKVTISLRMDAVKNVIPRRGVGDEFNEPDHFVEGICELNIALSTKRDEIRFVLKSSGSEDLALPVPQDVVHHFSREKQTVFYQIPPSFITSVRKKLRRFGPLLNKISQTGKSGTGSRESIGAIIREYVNVLGVRIVDVRGLRFIALDEFWSPKVKNVLSSIKMELPGHLEKLLEDLVRPSILAKPIDSFEPINPFEAHVESTELDKRRMTQLQALLEAVEDPENDFFRNQLQAGVRMFVLSSLIESIEQLFSAADRQLHLIVEPSINLNLGQITYLGPLRATPQRVYTLAEIQEALFFPDRYRDDFTVFRNHIQIEMRKRLQELGLPDYFAILPVSSQPSLSSLYTIMVGDRSSGRGMNLCDVGFGISQVIPILLAVEGNKESYFPHPLIMVEQPELHLHPSAQSRLAKIFMDGLHSREDASSSIGANANNSRFIIETHSEHLIRGFQVLIAKGHLKHDEIAIYYVSKNNLGNGIVREMHLDENGFFDEPWPEGFFDQGLRQSLEMIAGKN